MVNIFCYVSIKVFAAKIMDIDKVPAVIKDISHDEFVDFIVKKCQKQKQQTQETSSKDKKSVPASTYEIEMSHITDTPGFASIPPRY